MTPRHKIMREILLQASKDCPDLDLFPLSTPEQINDAYDRLINAGAHYDYESEFRSGEVETDILAPSSRHYESRSVAAKMSDGSWIGWVFWFGGGKHGQPGIIPWMDDAYELDCVEEEKLVLVRTFTRKPS